MHDHRLGRQVGGLHRAAQPEQPVAGRGGDEQRLPVQQAGAEGLLVERRPGEAEVDLLVEQRRHLLAGDHLGEVEVDVGQLPAELVEQPAEVP